jgi:hypothetical protein
MVRLTGGIGHRAVEGFDEFGGDAESDEDAGLAGAGHQGTPAARTNGLEAANVPTGCAVSTIVRALPRVERETRLRRWQAFDGGYRSVLAVVGLTAVGAAIGRTANPRRRSPRRGPYPLEAVLRGVARRGGSRMLSRSESADLPI